MRKYSVLYLLLTLAVVGPSAACGDDPIPTTPSQPTTSELVGIDVIGPDSLAAGQAVQFIASIRLADGTTKSATSMPNLRWRSSDSSVMSVSASGVVTAAASRFGEAAMITADITPMGIVQATREVVVRRKAVVTGTLEVTQTGPAGQISYVCSVTLTEAGGVPATVTEVWITFHGPWEDQFSFAADELGQKRVPANGTLTLDPLTCFGGFREQAFQAFNVGVWVSLTDDSGYTTYVHLSRDMK